MTDTWIERVRAADAEAEAAWQVIDQADSESEGLAYAVIAIAAELRAQRIARRPGAGQP